LIVRRIGFTGTRHISWSVDDRPDDKTLDESTESAILNKFGKDGWELVTAQHVQIQPPDDLDETDTFPNGVTTYYLKRSLA
jgi:hypothetical protein